MSTEWRARLDRKTGTKILCGRQVRGEPGCQGKLGTRVEASDGKAWAAIGPEYRPADAAEPMAAGSLYVAAGRVRRGRQRNITGRHVRGGLLPELPFRLACPACGCTAVIDSGVLVLRATEV